MWAILCIIVGIVCFFAGRISAVNTNDYQEGYLTGWDDALDLSETFYTSEDRR